MTKLTLRFSGLSALFLLACNTSEPPKAEASPAPQTPTQVVTAAAPVTAAPVAEPVATAVAVAGSAQTAAAGGTPAPGAKTNADAPTNTPPAGTVRGPAAGNDTYSTWLESVGSYTAGQPGQIKLMLEAKAPYHCNEEYPYKFTFGAAPGNVSFPSAVVKDMKVHEMSAQMAMPIQATGKGAATIQGTFNFSVCSKDKCLIEKANLTLPIEIK